MDDCTQHPVGMLCGTPPFGSEKQSYNSAMNLSLSAELATLSSLHPAYFLAPLGAIAALFMAAYFYANIMKASEGDEAMIRIASAVRAGAYAYLRRQRNVVMLVFAGLVAALLFMSYGLHLQPALSALGVPIAGILSGLCGHFGMKTATNASARTTAAARHSLNDGLRIAFRAGAVMGLCVTGFALLDVSVWFFLLTQVFDIGPLTAVTTVMLSFAMGASLQALFARVGGGIYTKAADVGADLVGKVEAGIPEDDARNPATIADNVGDNVGDVAGMGADLYESYYGSIMAAMALGAAAAIRAFAPDVALDAGMRLVIVPLALAGMGILTSIFSIFLVRTREGADMGSLLRSLHGGVWASSGLIVVASGALLYWLLGPLHGEIVTWWGVWLAIIVGLAAGLVIAQGTEYYTSYDHGPTRRIAANAQTGPATVIISGIAEGMLSTWIPLLTVVAAILVAFIASGGGETFLMGVYGVGVAAVGMLSTLAITLATDAYGPIADNAGGNAEMTHQPAIVRQRTDMLDSLGNTTAAVGKGFAIGSAALTAMALLSAFLITVQTSLTQQVTMSLNNPTTTPPATGNAGGLASNESALITDSTLPNLTYQNHGLFAITDPLTRKPDAGLLLAIDTRGVRNALATGGQAANPRWDELHNLYVMDLLVDGRVHDTFQVVPAARASLPQIMQFFDVTLANPRLLGGLFIGVLAVFVFSAMTMNAVGRAAFAMMQECRRQFEIMRRGFKAGGMSDADIADPLKWPYEVTVDGHQYPDYANCVAISTRGAQREMILPALLAVVIPIAVGLVLGVAGTMGMLAGALVSGFAMAIFMANAGGAWDNAKKYIETGELGGKGSPAHKAGVVGDTVGDPFKDTSGPSLNILIKLISIVSVVFAGLIVRYSPVIADWLHLQ